MFAITYSTWKSICKMYFEQNKGRLSSYLQWFPFSRLSKSDKDYIVSEEFYTQYIESGSIILYTAFLSRSNNYLQKMTVVLGIQS